VAAHQLYSIRHVQFVTTVPARDNSGLCGKSTVFTHKIGFGGDRKEGEAPMYQFVNKNKNRQGNMLHTVKHANS